MVLWYLWLWFFHSSPVYKIKFVRHFKKFVFNNNLTCAFKKVFFLFWSTCICELFLFLKSKDILLWGIERWGPALWSSLLMNTILKQLLVYVPSDVGACVHPHFYPEINDVRFHGFPPFHFFDTSTFQPFSQIYWC